MKLIFAVLDVSLTMGLTRCYKTEGFFTFIQLIVTLFWCQKILQPGHPDAFKFTTFFE